MSGHLTCPNCGHENRPDRALCTECSGALVAPSAPFDSGESGRYLGRMISQRYRVVERLARGGMGEVYIAEHAETRQLVAVKFLHKRYAGDASFAARFFNEARYASQVTHPNAVATYDFGRLEDGTLFMVMEFVRGQSLRRVVRAQGIIPVQMAVRITSQVAEVLASAHEKKIIHRDVKPDNIMLVQGAGGRVSVKVLDFGIAKILDDESGNHTEPGVMFGTPEYMSPEQALGNHYDHRVDIYALGLVLYYMLAGNPPFRSKNKMAVLQQQAKDTPPPITRVSKQPLPKPLVELIDTMLSKVPDDRPATMVEVLERLDVVLSDPALEADILSMESAPMPILSESGAAHRDASKGGRVSPPSAAKSVRAGEEYTAISQRNDDPSLAPVASDNDDPYHFTRPITLVPPLSLSKDSPENGARVQPRERTWLIAAIVALCTVVIILALPWLFSKSDSSTDDIEIASALEDDATADDVANDDTAADKTGDAKDAAPDDTPAKNAPPAASARHTEQMQRAKDALRDGDLGEMRAALSAIPTTDPPEGFGALRSKLLRAERLSADVRSALEKNQCNGAAKAADALASEFNAKLAAPYRARIQQCTAAAAKQAERAPAKVAAPAPKSTPKPAPRSPANAPSKPAAKPATPPAAKERPPTPAAAKPDAPRALPDNVSKPSEKPASSAPQKTEPPASKPTPKPTPKDAPVDVLPPMEL